MAKLKTYRLELTEVELLVLQNVVFGAQEAAYAGRDEPVFSCGAMDPDAALNGLDSLVGKVELVVGSWPRRDART